VQHALAVAEPPKGIEYVMDSFRAAASALRCLAMATVTISPRACGAGSLTCHQYSVPQLGSHATPCPSRCQLASPCTSVELMLSQSRLKGEASAAAESDGRPPPPDAVLQCGCNAAGSPQIWLAQAEYECAFVQARRQAGSSRRRQDLETLVQVSSCTGARVCMRCMRLKTVYSWGPNGMGSCAQVIRKRPVPTAPCSFGSAVIGRPLCVSRTARSGGHQQSAC
jgi:hypothetical protein